METEKITCPGCDRKFNSIDTMTNHGRSIHWWSEKQIEGMKREHNKTGLENATARPWEANTESDASLKRSLEVIRSGNKEVAFTGHPDFDALTEEERKANAALIVRAVNSHDALVEAVENALVTLLPPINSGIRSMMENALKLAKGK